MKCPKGNQFRFGEDKECKRNSYGFCFYCDRDMRVMCPNCGEEIVEEESISGNIIHSCGLANKEEE